jgi:type VI secretion system secreted protein Hcp
MKLESKRSRSSIALASLALACSLALAWPAYAELNAIVRITGAAQGQIKGSVTQKGREGAIAVIATAHELNVPVDAATGRASGKRQHKPFVITKELDKSSVPLRAALVQNETLSEVVVQYYAPSKVGAVAGAGAEALYLTVKLHKARITNIRHIMPNNKNPELQKLAAYEEISFAYEDISWEWADGGLKAEDGASGASK